MVSLVDSIRVGVLLGVAKWLLNSIGVGVLLNSVELPIACVVESLVDSIVAGLLLGVVEW